MSHIVHYEVWEAHELDKYPETQRGHDGGQALDQKTLYMEHNV